MIFKSSNGIFNGLFYHMTRNNMKDYIKIETSSNYVDSDGTQRDPWIIFKFENSTERWVTKGTENEHWIQIKLLIYKFRIKSYSIRSVEKSNCLRGWKLSVSSNYGATYKTIDSVPFTTDLYDFNTIERHVNDTTTLFNTFKFTMIGNPISGNLMRINSLEFFGAMSFATSCTKYRSRSSITSSILLYFIFISYRI